MFSTVLHATGVVWFGYALYFNLSYVKLPPHMKDNPKYASMEAYPGHWKYLTVWDIVLQLVYHSVALINDMGGSNTVVKKRQSPLQRLRDTIYNSFAFPIGMFVSITFWGLYALDRKLVLPKEMDVVFPSWLNHAVHTGPISFMLISLFTVPKRKPSKKFSLAATSIFTGIYLSWVTWVHSVSGVWAYPILDVLNTVQRLFFFGGSCMLAVAFCYMGVKLTKKIWGDIDELKVEEKKKSLKKKSKRA